MIALFLSLPHCSLSLLQLTITIYTNAVTLLLLRGTGSSQFEPARNHGLKDFLRIVLSRDSSELPQVVTAVAAERILVFVGVVEVDEPVILLYAFGVVVQFSDSSSADLIEEVVISCVGPC